MRLAPLFLKTSMILISSSLYASSYNLSISADTTIFDYTETDSTGILDTENSQFGDITGLTINFEPSVNGFYINGSYSEGNTDYIGGTIINPIYGTIRSVNHNQIDDYSAGYKTTTFLDHNNVEIPIKIGIGYRGWLRELPGYDELYEWTYFDIGIGLHTKFTNNIAIGIDANYRSAFNAQMYETMNINTYQLKNVYGYKITIPVEIALNRSWSTFFSYNYEYWNIGASDPVGGYYEPDSETKNQTMSVGIIYKF